MVAGGTGLGLTIQTLAWGHVPLPQGGKGPIVAWEGGGEGRG